MTTRTALLTLLGTGLAATLGAQARPQARPQAPVFGTGIEIINLSLSVTDAQNNFVTSLGEGISRCSRTASGRS